MNLFLTDFGLIFGDSLLLRDPPGFLVVGAGGEEDLGHYGLEVGHDGAVFFLLFDDLIEHAIVVVGRSANEGLLVGEDIFEFDLAEFPGLFGFIIIGEEGEVKKGGALVGFDHDGDVADVGEQAFVLDDVAHSIYFPQKLYDDSSLSL